MVLSFKMTGLASMRPRVFPAEDFIFLVKGDLCIPASMRPRVFPAEDTQQHALEVDVARLQ